MTDYLCTVTPLKCIWNCFFFFFTYFFSSFPSLVVHSLLYLLTLGSYSDCIHWKMPAMTSSFIATTIPKIPNSRHLFVSHFPPFRFRAMFCIFGLLVLGLILISLYIIVSMKTNKKKEQKERKNPVLFLFIHFFCLWTEKSQIFLRSQIFWLDGWVRAMCISISLGMSMRKFLILFLSGACDCFPLRTSILSSFPIFGFVELTTTFLNCPSCVNGTAHWTETQIFAFIRFYFSFRFDETHRFGRIVSKRYKLNSRCL